MQLTGHGNDIHYRTTSSIHLSFTFEVKIILYTPYLICCTTLCMLLHIPPYIVANIILTYTSGETGSTAGTRCVERINDGNYSKITVISKA